MWPNCTQIPSSGELWWSWSWQSYDDDYWYFRIMEALWMFLKCKFAQQKSNCLHAYANYAMFTISNTISTSIIVMLRYAASLFLEHHLPWAEGNNYQYRFSYFGLCNFICSRFYSINSQFFAIVCIPWWFVSGQYHRVHAPGLHHDNAPGVTHRWTFNCNPMKSKVWLVFMVFKVVSWCFNVVSWFFLGFHGFPWCNSQVNF